MKKLMTICCVVFLFAIAGCGSHGYRSLVKENTKFFEQARAEIQSEKDSDIPRKYEFVEGEISSKDGWKVYRIRAIRTFSDVNEGDLGGWISSEKNLSHKGNCWVYDEARVRGSAIVFENAQIRGEAVVQDQALVYGNAVVKDKAFVWAGSRVFGNAKVFGEAELFDSACVYEDADVGDHALVEGFAKVHGNCSVEGFACVYGKAEIQDNVLVSGWANVRGVKLKGKYSNCVMYIAGSDTITPLAMFNNSRRKIWLKFAGPFYDWQMVDRPEIIE